MIERFKNWTDMGRSKNWIDTIGKSNNCKHMMGRSKNRTDMMGRPIKLNTGLHNGLVKNLSKANIGRTKFWTDI